jgi:hypothetical protein
METNISKLPAARPGHLLGRPWADFTAWRDRRESAKHLATDLGSGRDREQRNRADRYRLLYDRYVAVDDEAPPTLAMLHRAHTKAMIELEAQGGGLIEVAEEGRLWRSWLTDHDIAVTPFTFETGLEASRETRHLMTLRSTAPHRVPPKTHDLRDGRGRQR